MRSLLHRSLLVALLAALTLTTSNAHAQKPASAYSVTEWKIGGTGFWDYLQDDSAAHRLYVTHGPRVEVVNTDTGKVVGAVEGLGATHGVAFDTDGKTGYVADSGVGAVVVFDRTTFAKLASVPTGAGPDGLVFEPVTKTVWSFNGRSKTASVISAADRKVVYTIDLPGRPEFPAADGKGNVYDNIEDKNEIVRFDAKTGKITATWPLAGCESPSGFAIDPAGMRLFSVCDGGVMAITDARTGKQLGKAKIGEGPDAAGYDEKLNIAYSSNGEGTLTIVDASKLNYPVLATVPTRRGARTMTVDSATGRVFTVTAAFGPAPAPTPEHPRQRPSILPDSFTVLVVGK